MHSVAPSRTSPGQPQYAFPAGSTAGNLLDDLIAFLDSCNYGDDSMSITDRQRACEQIRPVVENWLFGNRQTLLPNYLVKIVGGSLENRYGGE